MADPFEEGIRTRREVLGDAHVDRAETGKTAFDEDFQSFITRYAWGEVWQRGTLDRRERHLITIAMLCAMGKERELAMHLRATRNTGVTRDEVREILHQVAIYAGLPAANAGFAIAKQVFAEEARG
jgi:4-carboxymuconolactone decarboxylase